MFSLCDARQNSSCGIPGIDHTAGRGLIFVSVASRCSTHVQDCQNGSDVHFDELAVWIVSVDVW